MLLNGKDCERDFGIKAFKLGNDFSIIEWGKVCATAFNFDSAPLDGAITK